uniref:Uncharacterized protein n=2 Tax=Caenorhabditis japonica TaxID=281687 RepID=A0A8R1IL53_CAEJA
MFEDIDAFLLILDVFADRNLDDVDIAQSTRKELAERDPHIASLTSRATAIHCALPGKGPQLHDSTLDKLRDRIEKLEARLTKTEKEKGSAKKQASEPPVEEKSSPDRTSRSSLQLAMEAYGTATEDDSVISEAVTAVQKSTDDVTAERVIILPDNTVKVIEDVKTPENIAEVSTSEILAARPAQEAIERTVREVPVDVYEETANISSGDELQV